MDDNMEERKVRLPALTLRLTDNIPHLLELYGFVAKEDFQRVDNPDGSATFIQRRPKSCKTYLWNAEGSVIAECELPLGHEDPWHEATGNWLDSYQKSVDIKWKENDATDQ